MTWFKQASFYCLGASVDSALLTAALEKRPFTQPAGLDWFSEGWGEIASFHSSPVLSLQQRHFVRLRREDKVLPPAVIRKAVDTKVAEIEAKELRTVGRKEKLALKEQITDDLLPRAFTRQSSLMGYADNTSKILVVASATPARAEGFVSKLREALPPFPATLPRTRIAPHTAMTDWLAAGAAPQGFDLDSDAVLRDSGESGAQVRVSRIDLTADEIRQHIATGKQVTRIGLIWQEKIRFQLTDALQLRRIQFLDLLQDQASQTGEDRESLLEGTLTIMSEELGSLIADVVRALGGLED
ncbi:recombination-associated protein RdgC [Chromobacterium haemolyticum]|uniref:recombination-associated protein RdgC n=1 Tax=Chromobacterium haemolyticum TaxID=394935 RepID=UPI0002FAF80C|nr:recombination-associated protein RdgC [Chromobacterium haemolyticum]